MSVLRPRRVQDAVFRELEDSHTVIVASDGSQALVLNPMAGVIWELCDGSRTVREIASFICENSSGGEADRVVEDAEEIISQLVEQGLIDNDSRDNDSR